MSLSEPTAPAVNSLNMSTSDIFNGQVDGLDTWADDFFDITFDWFTWSGSNPS